MTVYRVLGTTDERTTCDCCGRTNLKATVVLVPSDGGPDVFYGSDCAARALGVAPTRVKRLAAAADARHADAAPTLAKFERVLAVAEQGGRSLRADAEGWDLFRQLKRHHASDINWMVPQFTVWLRYEIAGLRDTA
jgi:hypothetical protein